MRTPNMSYLLKNVTTYSVALAFLLGGPTSVLPGAGHIPSALAQDDDFDFDLSGDEDKKKKKKKKKPRKKRSKKSSGSEDMGMGFEALDVSVKSVEKESMEKGLDMMKNEDYAGAAVAFDEIYNNPKAKQFFQSAEYQLAKALYRMRMYHSSLQKFGKVLDKGVAHKYFKTSLEWLFFISHKITDQAEVLKDIAKYSDIEFPEKYKDEFLFLLAKYFYFQALEVERGSRRPGQKKAKPKKRKKKPVDELGFDLGEDDTPTDVGGGFGLDLEVGSKTAATALPTDAVGFLSKSKALILQISEESKFFPRGKYLEGIILYKQGSFQQAVESFKEVVVLLHPKKGKVRDDRLREKGFFQLARIHYEHKQFNYALFYYDRIHRDSIGWLESLFEASWAWFRIAKYQKALGNLITLDSPFFRDEYFPEGLILKAVTYYENCRYPESNQIVEEFKRRYEPLHRELEKLLAKAKSPKAYYKQLLAIQKAPPRGRSGKLLKRILKVALADKDLRQLNASVLEIEKEIRRVHKSKSVFSRSKLADKLVESLRKRKEELMGDAGLLTKARLEQERDFLGGLMGQAIRIVLENDTAAKDLLVKAQSGMEDRGPTLRNYSWTAATDDEKIYWPYQGEYWRDELGTYEYTLTWGCRKRAE